VKDAPAAFNSRFGKRQARDGSAPSKRPSKKT